MSMETLAKIFDLPETSEKYQALAAETWLGGSGIVVRYFLGRLLVRNLFRESNSEVEQHIISWLLGRASKSGVLLMNSSDLWTFGAELTRDEFEVSQNRSTTLNAREAAAVLAFLRDPTITIAALANLVGSTEKQLGRMTLLNYVRALPSRRQRTQS